MTSTAVLVFEPDEVLAQRLVRFLASHRIRAGLAHRQDQLQVALTTSRYLCVVVGAEAATALTHSLCAGANTPLVYASEWPGGDLVARIMELACERPEL